MPGGRGKQGCGMACVDMALRESSPQDIRVCQVHKTRLLPGKHKLFGCLSLSKPKPQTKCTRVPSTAQGIPPALLGSPSVHMLLQSIGRHAHEHASH